ncbi:MAG: ribonuclease III [Desulfobacteraceae bacterium IS3]|nr:MAG: ribonuclease III [Desulfobacteraceae bacterium IS3]
MDLSILEKNLLYEFKDKSLLDESCRHSSYVNEQPFENLRDNERLEFLGDAVLNLVVGHILMTQYPELTEGDLSRMRAGLVNEFQLAKVARSMDLGAYLQLGKGEIQTEGRKKKSILADTFEAIIAAVYLDGGFEAAFRFVERHFSRQIHSIAKPTLSYDYKSQLQEEVQVTQGAPVYTVIQENGPDHDKTFVIQISVGDLCTEGVGKSKKTAEQDAAKKALELLGSGL